MKNIIAIFFLTTLAFVYANNSYASSAFRAFSADSYWNKPMPANAPIDPNSDLYISDAMDTSVSSPTFLRLTGAPDHGSSGERWSYPIYWAEDGDPEYTIVPDRYGPTITARIPVDATPQEGSDGGIIIFDIGRNKVVEMYKAVYDSSADTWSSTSTKRYILDSNGLSKRVEGSDNDLNDGHRGLPSSMRAIRIDEVESGSINRRLECFWHATGRPNSSTPWYYWPMDGYERDKGGITPEGLVIRIKQDVDLDSKGLSPAARIIAQTLKDYGCTIGDNEGGTKNSLKLQRGPTEWSEVYPDLSLYGLSSIPFSDFEFIKGGYDPDSSGTQTPPTSKPGDANLDDLVDEADYSIWFDNYLQSVSGSSNGDFNDNSLVDGIDYVIWLNNYGT